MQGLERSKRVSWATDANLCQVRLFLSEDSPSQVRVGAQDHLQAKKTLSGLHLNGLVADDNLPPGFEGFSPANQLQNKVAQIPVVKWRRPPKFILDVAWQVVNGQESKEAEIQKQRELRVLEAIYPRQSAIPPNAAVTPDLETAIPDDQTLLSIPITPIEEEDPSGEPSSDSAASSHKMFPSSHNSSPDLDNTRVSAASIAGSSHQDVLKTALTAVAKSNEQIDHDLLMKILSNPTILEQLARHEGQETPSGSHVAPKPTSDRYTPTRMESGPPLYKVDPTLQTGSSSSGMVTSGPLYPYPNGTRPMPHQQPPQVPSLQSGPVVPMKDINYYKNLIQQHGGEKERQAIHLHHPGINQDNNHTNHNHTNHSHTNHNSVITRPIINQDSSDNLQLRDSKPKIMKPCIYFNSSKGCRHGSNCVYQHDMGYQQRASSIPEMQGAKRMKMDREIRGSQSYT